MSQNNKLRIPKMPHSIENAAKILGVDKDNLISWILDGSIRACINYRTFHTDGMTYTAGVINSNSDIKSDYQRYLNDLNEVDCPLSLLFSTMHSKMLIHPSTVSNITEDAEYNEISFRAQIKGLWHIDDLDLVAELFEAFNDAKISLMVVPYIPDNTYDSYINQEIDDHITGVHIDASFNDIYISYEDIIRINKSLDEGTALASINTIQVVDNKSTIAYRFTALQQLSMVFVQLIESDLNLGNKTILAANSSLQKIERLRKNNNYSQLEIDSRKFTSLISNGKSLLKEFGCCGDLAIEKYNPDNKKLRKLSIDYSKTLVQLIEAHSEFSYKAIDKPNDIYEAINKKLKINMQYEVFIETLEAAKTH